METDEDLDIRICDLFKGLAEVLKNDGELVVQFIHQSVNDFLLEKGFQILDNSCAGTVVGRGQFWLSRSCIKFFSLEEVERFANSLRGTGCSRSESPEVEEEDYFDMLRYSVSRCWVHAQEVENANMPQDDLAALTSEPTDGVLPSWFAIYDILDSDWLLNYWEPGNATILHFASRYNLISFVDVILTQNVWADQRDRESQTPLAIAAGEGH